MKAKGRRQKAEGRRTEPRTAHVLPFGALIVDWFSGRSLAGPLRASARKLRLPPSAFCLLPSAFCLLFLSGCSLFHPKAGEGAATVTQAGNVTVNFVGVTGFTEAELRDTLFDPLDTIQHDGLSPAAADDCAFFLELFYRKNGYTFVNVNYVIASPQNLRLEVKEGPLVVLGDIRFTGNDHYPNTDNFKQYIIGQTRERFPSSRQDLPYVETDVQKGTDLVQRFYLSEGYLQAQVGTPATVYTNNRTRANLTVPIVEGQRYRFGPVALAGPLVFPEREMRGLIADQIPLPYTRQRVDGMARTLEDYYKKHGYFNAKVTAVSDPVSAGPDGRVPTTLQVDSGPLFHFDGSRIVGTDRLKPEYLRNRFKQLSGEVYDPAKLDELYQAMIRTGLFAQLRVEPVPQADDTLRLDIGVKEAKGREVGFSLGYGTFEGVIFGVELRDRDFMGTGRPISFTLDYSTRTISGELLYVDPYLLESDVEMRLSLHALTRDLDAYTKQQVGASAQFSRAFTKKFKASIFVESNSVTITKYDVQDFNLGPKSYTVDAIGATASLDLRDNPVAPTKGFVTNGTVDVASSALGGNVDYVRGTFRATYLLPLPGKTLLLVGFRAGIIKPYGESGGQFRVDSDRDPKTPEVLKGSMLPIDERFFLGGSTTVRSYAERQLGPYDHNTSGEPIGGEAYTLANVEYQFPLKLAADLKGAVFVDAGNLRERADEFGFGGEHYAVGAGIRYNLPIGPLRMDYGVNPSPGRNEAFGAFQFSFGLAF